MYEDKQIVHLYWSFNCEFKYIKTLLVPSMILLVMPQTSFSTLSFAELRKK